MPDREKVIRHFQDAIVASGNNNKWRFVRLDIVEEAIDLLKEQEPVKPKYEDFFGSRIAICENCGDCLMKYKKYCPGCGRKVKWE